MKIAFKSDQWLNINLTYGSALVLRKIQDKVNEILKLTDNT